MHELTAAHRTLPFDTWLEVNNLDNGKSVKVRINDRGPFVGGRIIDLSLAAAGEIGMVRPGPVVWTGFEDALPVCQGDWVRAELREPQDGLQAAVWAGWQTGWHPAWC